MADTLTGFLPRGVVFSPAAFFEGGLLQNDASYKSNLILDLVTWVSYINKYDPTKKLKFQLCLSYAGCDEMTFLYGQE